ncbi:MAG: nitrite reductase small subunit NirD [Acidobacteria bacterium]|nr:nitrite reductase small subunit NirD [Acidobacteriota bacterium]
MTEHCWIRIAAVDTIPLREGRAVQIGDREIAIFNLGDRFLATGNRCPHRGGPLCDGIVTGTAVVCPLHGWKVGLDDGRVMRPAAEARCVATYPVRVDEGLIVVGMPASAGAASGRSEGAAA